MTEVTKNITVDLSRKGNTRIVFARQNDRGSRTLNITLTDGGAPYLVPTGTVATINILRPDEASASFAATVNESGGITYTLGLWALSVTGSVRCSVSLYGADETKLTSSDFYLDVLDALYSDDDFSEDVDSSAMTAIYSSIASLEARLDEAVIALEDKHDDELAEVNGKIKALCGASGEVTLVADDWGDDLAVTLAVAELGEQDMIVFDPVSAADRELICDHEVFISAKAQAGAVSVSARTKPSKDIALCYFIIRGGV